MKIWLDSTNTKAVKQAVDLGILFGVTTNPTLIVESGKPMRTVLQELLDHQDGPVAAQVVAEDVKGMVEQGKQLYDFSDRIIVKVPVTQAGLQAIYLLSEQEIPTMATVILEPHQALAASQVGASYIAPYLGHIERDGKDPYEMLLAISIAFESSHSMTEILAASVGSLEQLCRCAALDVQHVTLKDPLFSQFIATDPKTQERVTKFSNEWKKAKLSFL